MTKIYCKFISRYVRETKIISQIFGSVTDSLDGELYHNDLDTDKTPIEYVDPGCRPVICKINKKCTKVFI